MEGQLQSSPKLDSPTENDDFKYVSGLSTVLVASIQEAKDRIAQIEYIFCSQLYPNFKSKSKLLRRICSDAKRAADDEWKGREDALLLQIERLKRENQEVVDGNRSLKLEVAKIGKERQNNATELLARIDSQQVKVDELELNLKKKSKEVDEGLKLQSDLLQLIQIKAATVIDRDKQLKENEERKNVLLAKYGDLDKKVKTLQEVLREKTEEVARGNELTGNLFKKIEAQGSEIMNNENLLRDREKEKQALTAKLACLEETVCHLRSHQKASLNSPETQRMLEKSEKEKKLLLEKINGLEEKVNELQEDLKGRTSDVTKGMDLYQKTLEQIELKNAELLAEKRKRREYVDAYKRLKSQYNFLLRRSGLSEENMLSPHKSQDEPDSLRNNQNQITLADHEDRDQDTSPDACDKSKTKSEITVNDSSDDKKQIELAQTSTTDCPTGDLKVALKCPSTAKYPMLAGTKRPASCWRDTRAHQGKSGPDPHDDFLDTPLENIRGNISKATREELSDRRVSISKDMSADSSDDETQDVSADKNPQKNPKPVMANEGKGFKFVEPVRKKAERENLKGVECRQCKKFYDAVLCNNEEFKDGNNSRHNLRCEHHEGVSRHRYKYVPPMTPEGFWNIGFESEI